MKKATIFLLLFFLSLPGMVPAQDEDDDYGGFPCEGVLDSPDELAEILAGVPIYASTYVMVFRDETSDEIFAIDSPALKDLSLVAYAESPAAVLMGQTAASSAETQAFEKAAAARIVEDVLDSKVDIGILWAPLAGLVVLELDFNYELSLRTAGLPTPAPAALATTAAADGPSECAEEIAAQLGGYGVVPAEKLVPIDIRDLLATPAPGRDLERAREGSALYAEHCAKCHGPEAVAEPSLAPVDLLVSVPRFSFPGFLYIVLNGRSQNGMPGFNGTLSQDELSLVYQYSRERAHGTLTATQLPSESP